MHMKVKKFRNHVNYHYLKQSHQNLIKRKTNTHGKIFTLEKDTNKSGKIDINDLEWNYLNGDGDFRSDEVKN